MKARGRKRRAHLASTKPTQVSFGGSVSPKLHASIYEAQIRLGARLVRTDTPPLMRLVSAKPSCAGVAPHTHARTHAHTHTHTSPCASIAPTAPPPVSAELCVWEGGGVGSPWRARVFFGVVVPVGAPVFRVLVTLLPKPLVGGQYGCPRARARATRTGTSPPPPRLEPPPPPPLRN